MNKDEKKELLKRFLIAEGVSDDKEEYRDSLIAVCNGYLMFPHEVSAVLEALPEEFDDLDAAAKLDDLDKRLIEYREEGIRKMGELIAASMKTGVG